MSNAVPSYYGRVSGKGGRMLLRCGPYSSREDAARECFARRPKARECSTSRAVAGWSHSNNCAVIIDTHADIRWHKNWKLLME